VSSIPIMDERANYRAPGTQCGAPRGRSALGLPLPALGTTRGEAVVMTRLPSGDDDVMPYKVAGHAARMEHPEYGGATRAVCLRIAPRLGASGLARLGRIQPRHALEQQLVVPWREARPPELRNGLTWACAAAARSTQSASVADKQCGDRSRILLSVWSPLGVVAASPWSKHAKRAISVSSGGHRSRIFITARLKRAVIK
jgi:hypothetical protein